MHKFFRQTVILTLVLAMLLPVMFGSMTLTQGETPAPVATYGYVKACADITGDGNANAFDVVKMNAHARGTKLLW